MTIDLTSEEYELVRQGLMLLEFERRYNYPGNLRAKRTVKRCGKLLRKLNNITKLPRMCECGNLMCFDPSHIT